MSNYPMRSRKLLIFVLAAIAIFSAIWFFLTPAAPKSILQRSSPVMAFKSWPQSYQWIDANTILWPDTARSSGSIKLCVQDTTSHTDKVLTTLAIPRASHGWQPGNMAEGEDNGRTSPDGKWTIWATYKSYDLIQSNGRTHYHVATPASRAEQYVDFHAYYYRSYAAWTQNKNKWIEVRPDTHQRPHLVVHALTGALLSDVIIRLPSRSSASYSMVSILPSVIGVTPSNHALLWNDGSSFFDVDLNPSKPVIRPLTMPLPSPGSVLDVVLSPDGKHLLWRTHLQASRGSDVHRFLVRWIPSFEYRGTHILWVSDITGAHLHEVARETLQEMEQTTADNSDYTFSSFRWLPDSKHISFVYKQQIWLMTIS